jgi:hypothetical protein
LTTDELEAIMRRALVVLAAASGMALASGTSARTVTTSHAAEPPPAPATLQLKGAELGMTLDAWRALPFPGTPSPRVAASCSTDGAAKVGAPRTAVSTKPSVTVCTYASRYGDITLPQPFPLTSRSLARDPRYSFTEGRLTTIEFDTSIDAFNDLVALFISRYGPEQRTIRDQIGPHHWPRVRKIWRLPAASILLTDPAARPGQLSVQFRSGSPTDLGRAS